MFNKSPQIFRHTTCPFLPILDRKFGRMKRMTGQEEFAFKLRGPTRFDKFEIEFLVRPVDFVTDDRMTE